MLRDINKLRGLEQKSSKDLRKHKSQEKKETSCFEKEISGLAVVQSYSEQGYCHIITWDTTITQQKRYRILRKYHSRPKRPFDGDIFEIDKFPFQDCEPENGKLVYYSIIKKERGDFRLVAFSNPVIRLDDVYNVEITKKSKQLIVDCKLPKNVREVIIQKSYSHTPAGIYDGENVVHKKNIKSDNLVVQDKHNNIPTFYTIFCRYEKNRGVFVVSKGFKFDI